MLSTSSKKSQTSSKLTVNSFKDSLREQARKELLSLIFKAARDNYIFQQAKQNQERPNCNINPFPISNPIESKSIQTPIYGKSQYYPRPIHIPVITRQQFFYQQPHLQNQKIIRPISPIRPKIKTQRNGYIVFEKVIGKGTYSKVYEGIHTPSNMRVAVKQVEDVMENQLVCLKGFKSPYIVEMYDYWQEQSRTYIVLEYCQKNFREEKKNCTKQECIAYFLMVVQGLDVFVQNNTIHRDIKFENILIKDKIAKLSDFGLAKPLGSRFIVESLKCGTPYTMAPQILFNHSEKPLYTIKCDIWSMGILLHELLYDMHPFKYNMQMMAKCKRVNIKKSFPHLDDFIDKAIIFDEDKRINWTDSLSIFQNYKNMKQQKSRNNLLYQHQKKQISQIFPKPYQKQNKLENSHALNYPNNWIKKYQNQHHAFPENVNLNINIKRNDNEKKKIQRQVYEEIPKLFLQQHKCKVQKPIIIIKNQVKARSENGAVPIRPKKKRKQEEPYYRNQKGRRKVAEETKTQNNYINPRILREKQNARHNCEELLKQGNKYNHTVSYTLDVKNYLFGQLIVLVGILIIYMYL